MKKNVLTDTVFLEGSRTKFVLSVCIHARSRFFWQGKFRKIAKNASKNGLKSLHISILGMGLNTGIFAGLKIP